MGVLRVAGRACYTHLSGPTLCLYSEESLVKEEAWELLLMRFTLTSPTHRLLTISVFAWGAKGERYCATGDRCTASGLHTQGNPASPVTKTSRHFSKHFVEKLCSQDRSTYLPCCADRVSAWLCGCWCRPAESTQPCMCQIRKRLEAFQ